MNKVNELFGMLQLAENEHFKIEFTKPLNPSRPIPNHEFWIDGALHIHRDDDFKEYTNAEGRVIKPRLYLGQLLNGEVNIIKIAKQN